MDTSLFSVVEIMGETERILAQNMTLDNAIIFQKAYIETYFNEYMEVAIKREA